MPDDDCLRRPKSDALIIRVIKVSSGAEALDLDLRADANVRHDIEYVTS
jgi:hypothetical protein